MQNKIAITKTSNYEYPNSQDLFRPSKYYPEYPFNIISKHDNLIYNQVRDTLHLMELDNEHYGTSSWNPFVNFIKPDDSVLIKPNMVIEQNSIKDNGTDCLYTHPSVVAVVIDYVWIALKGKGKVVIGDAPMQECKFEELLRNSGYANLIDWYCAQGVPIEIVDFRELTSKVIHGLRVSSIAHQGKGKVIDLANASEFSIIHNFEKLRITNYDPNVLITHHTAAKNEYYISDYVLNADVIINIPKPKSHRKAGFTCAMKNFIGINVRKEYLPHHSLGAKEEGGDEYLKKNLAHKISSRLLDKRNVAIANNRMLIAQIYRILGKIIRVIMPYRDYSEGSWYGNNTISKTICDLNKIVLYADKDGHMCDTKQRQIFIVADMIICGEKEGPIAPFPKKVGIIAMGDDLLSFDENMATLLGFDANKIPYLVNAKNIVGKYKLLSDSEICFHNNEKLTPINLEPSIGWKGHIELKK